jgi:hypothetical protein
MPVGDLSQSPGIVRPFIKPDECRWLPSSGSRCHVSRQLGALIGHGMWIPRRTRQLHLPWRPPSLRLAIPHAGERRVAMTSAVKRWRNNAQAVWCMVRSSWGSSPAEEPAPVTSDGCSGGDPWVGDPLTCSRRVPAALAGRDYPWASSRR